MGTLIFWGVLFGVAVLCKAWVLLFYLVTVLVFRMNQSDDEQNSPFVQAGSWVHEMYPPDR